MRWRRNSCARANADGTVRSESSRAGPEAEGEFRTAMENPFGEARTIALFTRDARTAEFGQRLGVGIIADQSAPIAVRIHLRFCRATGEQEGKRDDKNAGRFHGPT